MHHNEKMQKIMKISNELHDKTNFNQQLTQMLESKNVDISISYSVENQYPEESDKQKTIHMNFKGDKKSGFFDFVRTLKSNTEEAIEPLSKRLTDAICIIPEDLKKK